MGNVWEALKKHHAEQAVGAQPAEAAQPPAPAAVAGRIEEFTAASPAAADAAKVALDALAGPVTPVKAAPASLGAPAVTNNYHPQLVAHHDRGGQITEQYRALRTNLLAQYNDRFCVMVTSSEPGEGKSVTCLNLAVVLAERQDRRVVVVDSDMRKGRLAELLNTVNTPGVADVLRGKLALRDLIRPTVYPNLFFVPSGLADADEVGELFGRPEVDEIVADLRRQFDYVLLDTPPVTVASDAGILGRAAGEALLVVRMNKTRRESVDRSIALLHAANVKLAGIVLTHQKYYIPHYLYRYS